MASIWCYPFIVVKTNYSVMLDLEHLKSNQISYCSHFSFATMVALRLTLTAALLVFHSIVPFVRIPKKFSIGGTSDYLFDKDFEIKERQLSAAGILNNNVQNK